MQAYSMNQKFLLVLLLITVVVIAGCTSMQTGDKTLPDGTVVKQDGTMIKTDGTMVKPDGTMILPNGTMIEPENQSMMSSENQSKYSGTVLAGSSAPLIDFKKADYDTAVKSDKLIVLYFYANWCPICRAEVPQLYAAFNELKTDNVIGFRVNYNDDQTDNNERALAQQFQIPYQHTKVFLKDGSIILKSPESWDKSRYLTEINKVII